MDTAFSEKSHADYSAYGVWGIFNREVKNSRGVTSVVPNLILLEAEKGKWDYDTLCRKVEQIKEEHAPDYFVVENKASGLSLIQDLRKRQFPVFEYNPEKDKTTRMYLSQPFFTSGKVWVPAAPLEDIYDSFMPLKWAKPLVEEVCGFPFAPKDDFADVTTMAILWMRDSYKMTLDEYESVDEEEEQEGGPRTNFSYWKNVTG